MSEEKEYVSDIITKEKISRWKNGDNIRISTEVGSGKTYWAINVLSDFARAKGKKILYLVHRKSLYNQMSEDILISNSGDVIQLETYQKITHLFGKGYNIALDYDYIVCDEFQFLVTDSDFIYDTEVMYDILNSIDKSIKIFISANNINVGIDFQYNYSTNNNNKNISNRVNASYVFNSYENVDEAISRILKHDNGDKVLFYSNNIKELEKLYLKYKKYSMIVVSENNKMSKYMDESKIEKLARDNKFDDRILFCTSAIDSGISIIDNKVKYVIVDELELEQLYQVIGRRRVLDDNDTFALMIRNYHNKRINGYLTQLKRKNDMVRNFIQNERGFCKQYGRKNLDNSIFYNDINGKLKLNKMGVKKLKYLIKTYESYINSSYIEVVGKELGINFNILDVKYENETIENYFESIVGKRLFKESQKELIEKINLRDYRGRLQRAFSTLEEYMKNETEYRLIKKINYSKKNEELYRKTYWSIVK